jgi:hypothetical protein
MHPQVRRLICAAIDWSEHAATGRRAAVPPAPHTRGLHLTLREAPASPAFVDWRYHGLPGGAAAGLVVVEEADGSRRLLRNSEGAARGLFAWGYGGTGPHTLAEVLTGDLLRDLARCPDCFGAITCAADLIRCRTCHNTGHRVEHQHIAAALVRRVISKLPRYPGATPTIPEAEWSLARSVLMAEVTRIGGRGRPTPDSPPLPTGRACDLRSPTS